VDRAVVPEDREVTLFIGVLEEYTRSLNWPLSATVVCTFLSHKAGGVCREEKAALLRVYLPTPSHAHARSENQHYCSGSRCPATKRATSSILVVIEIESRTIAAWLPDRWSAKGHRREHPPPRLERNRIVPRLPNSASSSIAPSRERPDVVVAHSIAALAREDGEIPTAGSFVN